jgi:cell division septum initiation protein DivIVA
VKRRYAEEIAGLQGQQEELPREVEDLKQQVTQLGSAQSASEKKIADFGAQLAQASREAESLRRQFLEEEAKSGEALGELGRIVFRRRSFCSLRPPNTRREEQMPAGGIIEHPIAVNRAIEPFSRLFYWRHNFKG